MILEIVASSNHDATHESFLVLAVALCKFTTRVLEFGTLGQSCPFLKCWRLFKKIIIMVDCEKESKHKNKRKNEIRKDVCIYLTNEGFVKVRWTGTHFGTRHVV
jgi:hypothetical protein